jgi:hypothetical protein
METPMTIEPRRYLAYMLRLWAVRNGDKLTWRASLESPHTGERWGFSSLEVLLAFLVEKTGFSTTEVLLQDDPSDLPK